MIVSSKLVDLLQDAFTLFKKKKEKRKFLITNCFNKLHGSFDRTWFLCCCLGRERVNQIGAPLKPLQLLSWTDAAFWHFL